MRFAEFKKNRRCPEHIQIRSTAYLDPCIGFNPLAKFVHATGYSARELERKKELAGELSNLQKGPKASNAEDAEDLQKTVNRINAEYDSIGTSLGFYFQGHAIPSKSSEIPEDAHVLLGLPSDGITALSQARLLRLVRRFRDKGKFSVVFTNMGKGGRDGAIISVTRHPPEEKVRKGTAKCSVQETYYSPAPILRLRSAPGVRVKKLGDEGNGTYDLCGTLPAAWKRVPTEAQSSNAILNYHLGKYNSHLAIPDKPPGFRERFGALPVIGWLFKK